MQDLKVGKKCRSRGHVLRRSNFNRSRGCTHQKKLLNTSQNTSQTLLNTQGLKVVKLPGKPSSRLPRGARYLQVRFQAKPGLQTFRTAGVPLVSPQLTHKARIAKILRSKFWSCKLAETTQPNHPNPVQPKVAKLHSSVCRKAPQDCSLTGRLAALPYLAIAR